MMLWQYIKTLGDNFREVTPRRVYASAALSDASLRKKIKKHGIKTVIDLRLVPNFRPDIPEITVISAPLDDHGNVPIERVREIAGWLADPSFGPILIHCQGGRHRTSVIIAIYRIVWCQWTGKRAVDEAYKYGFYAHKHEAWAEFLHKL
jgi:tyrosine-protein phosphatase SIW14